MQLEFEEGTSSKFWRARVEGKTLYVNYGKLGTAGQTQVKDFADHATAMKEYEKVVREKRKKGYVDSSGGGREEDEDEELEDEEEEEEEEARPKRKAAGKPAAAAAPAARPAGGLRMVLESGPRRVETQLFLDGKTVRMDATESHASPEAAKKAFERLKRALAGEGYRES
ncbi:MAG TPA: WGR domain-containing protein [Kofleriaceae bacterium]|nr:WGR domain-containing protein [Kofleriaceae bacterium]